jgi:tetratricopeptide (TPR) repeat protein
VLEKCSLKNNYRKAMNDEIRKYQSRLDAAQSPEENIDTLNKLSWAYRNVDADKGLEYAEEAYDRARRIGYTRGEAFGLQHRAFFQWRISAFAEAVRLANEAVALFESSEDINGHASSLNILGNIAFSIGDYETALGSHLKSLSHRRTMNHNEGIASSLGNLGVLYKNLGDYGTSLDYHLECLHRFEELADERGVSMALDNIGVLHNERADYEQARIFNQKSLDIKRRTGDRYGEANALNNLGNAHRNLGNLSLALDLYEQSFRLQEALKNKQGMTFAMDNTATVLVQLGKYPQAFALYHQSLQIGEEIGDKRGQGDSFLALGKLFVKAPELWKR